MMDGEGYAMSLGLCLRDVREKEVFEEYFVEISKKTYEKWFGGLNPYLDEGLHGGMALRNEDGSISYYRLNSKFWKMKRHTFKRKPAHYKVVRSQLRKGVSEATYMSSVKFREIEFKAQYRKDSFGMHRIDRQVIVTINYKDGTLVKYSKPSLYEKTPKGTFEERHRTMEMESGRVTWQAKNVRRNPLEKTIVKAIKKFSEERQLKIKVEGL